MNASRCVRAPMWFMGLHAVRSQYTIARIHFPVGPMYPAKGKVMRRLFLLVSALNVLTVAANAQNTPPPCSPQNIVNTYYQQSCWNSVDCSTGYQCLDLRVSNDVVYGTTCDVQYVAICSQPGFPNEANERKRRDAKAVLAAVRAHARNRS